MKKNDEKYAGRTDWYVHPKDGGITNTYIASILGNENILETKCADGATRFLWRCNLEVVHHLKARQEKDQLSFDLYMSYESGKPQIFALDWTKKDRNRELIVLAHPIRGDVKGNTEAIRAIFRKLCLDTSKMIVPWFPLEILEVLDTENTKDRQRGIYMCLTMVKKAEELWLYGPHISDGMKNQVILALIMGIRIKAKSSGTRRDFALLKGTLEKDK